MIINPETDQIVNEKSHEGKLEIADSFAKTLGLLLLLNKEERFVAFVMTLCNEIASEFQCSRVSLGCLGGKYIKTEGISHIEKFELKMEAVQFLEAAMEEALDQDDEIVWPSDNEEWIVNLSHEKYCSKYGSEFMVSLPLRIDNDPIAVLSCERIGRPFSKFEIQSLRLICDQVVRRLYELKKSDRWFGARFGEWVRTGLSGLLGVEHTFAKLGGIIFFFLILYLFMGKLDYKVQAPTILKTDTIAWLTSPFDSYVTDVNAQVGDVVNKDDILIKLDTRELILSESSALADLHRYTRAAEKARAENALADMRIAQARRAQAGAKLESTRYYLERAMIKAPFSGILVNGEKKDILGAPAHKGKKLFEIARLEDYYLRIEVDESEIHEISIGNSGTISFLSRPKQKFSIHVKSIAPMSETTQEGNVFVVRAGFDEPPPPWLRPGMSGVGKVMIGKRPVIWILGHKTLDFILLHWWW